MADKITPMRSLEHGGSTRPNIPKWTSVNSTASRPFLAPAPRHNRHQEIINRYDDEVVKGNVI
jgi:hypothetical protein